MIKPKRFSGPGPGLPSTPSLLIFPFLLLSFPAPIKRASKVISVGARENLISRRGRREGEPSKEPTRRDTFLIGVAFDGFFVNLCLLSIIASFFTRVETRGLRTRLLLRAPALFSKERRGGEGRGERERERESCKRFRFCNVIPFHRTRHPGFSYVPLPATFTSLLYCAGIYISRGLF